MHIYLPVRKNIATTLDSLRVCLREVKAWLSNNFLSLNESKTELVGFGGPAMNDLPNLGELSPYCIPVVRDLGVVLDSSKFEKRFKHFFI